MRKSLDERIDEGVLWWFGHVEMRERDRGSPRESVSESMQVVIQCESMEEMD